MRCNNIIYQKESLPANEVQQLVDWKEILLVEKGSQPLLVFEFFIPH
jgi:hypothetical protein